MTLEVVVDDKFFEPLKLTGAFEKSVKVTAESVVRKPKKKATLVTASFQKESIDQAPVIVKNSKTKSNALKESKSKKSYSDKDILALISALGKRNKK